jgi:hypothetical protein
LSRCTSNRVFRDLSAFNHVSEQNSCGSRPAASCVDKRISAMQSFEIKTVSRRLSRSP